MITFSKQHAISFFIFFCGIINLIAQNDSNNAQNKKTTVVIERARKTEYKKDPETGNDIIYLSGDVFVNVDDGKTKVSIMAEELTLDRKKEMIYADGLISMERISSDNSKEILRGGSLLFNISSMEGIFQGGTIIQDDSPLSGAAGNESKVIVSADVFGREKGGTVSFKKGVLTFCEEPNPHWTIKASRIWLLPGNEFAFLNALLYVGEIPVFYLPVFYYPKDEMIFNPVFGYRQREGYFVQTTTYFIGRKPEQKVDEESLLSLTSSGPAKEQKREGLFLRNLNENLKSRPPHTLKLMADIYSNLGGMIGVFGEFVPQTIIRKISFDFDIGFSRNLYSVSKVYIPYDSKGETTWNSSSLFGFSIPFRYKMDFSLSMTVKNFNLNVNLPLWSDPFFQGDFLDRKESMDWLAYFMQNTAKEETTTTNTLSSFLWNINGNFRPQIKRTNPWISIAEIGNFTSSISFSSRNVNSSSMPAELLPVSPHRQFYFPSKIVPFTTDFQIGGTFFEYPKKLQTVQTIKETLASLELYPPLELQDKDASDTIIKEGTDSISQEDLLDNTQQESLTVPVELANSEDSVIVDDNPYLTYIDDFLPNINPSIPGATSISGLTYSLKYTIVPKFASEITYSSIKWQTLDDIQWSDYANSYYNISGQTSIDSNLQWRGNFISLKNILQLSSAWVDHPTISSDYYSQVQKNQMILNDYAARQATLTLSHAFSFKPFTFTEYFKPVALTWNWKTKLMHTAFKGTVDNPEWDIKPAEWDEKSFEQHTVSLITGISLHQYDQTLTITSNLPPRLDSYIGTLALRSFFGTFSIGTGIKKEKINSDTWVKNPLETSLSLKFFNNILTADQSYTYNMEDEHSSSYNASLKYKNGILSLSYSMLYTTPYTLDKILGWQAKKQQDFIPRNISLKFNPPKKMFYQWKNRIAFSLGLNTEILFDMIRVTESYFTFSPSITFTINQFVDLTFSSESRNDVIFRYVQGLANFTPEIPGERNILVDLWNSFSFWDDTKRENAGFKLKTLSVKLEHQLHDWLLKTELTIKPRLLTTRIPYEYDFSPYFSFGISWKPFKGMKTVIVDEYGEFVLNP